MKMILSGQIEEALTLIRATSEKPCQWLLVVLRLNSIFSLVCFVKNIFFNIFSIFTCIPRNYCNKSILVQSAPPLARLLGRRPY